MVNRIATIFTIDYIATIAYELAYATAKKLARKRRITADDLFSLMDCKWVYRQVPMTWQSSMTSVRLHARAYADRVWG
jgi:hypothetical protein